MKNSPLCTSLLLVIFLFTSSAIFSQYAIEKKENGLALLKKGKVQTAKVTELTYLESSEKPVRAFYAQMKKKNALVFIAEGSENWTLIWVDEVITPEDGAEYYYGNSGLVNVKQKGKYGLYSCIYEKFIVSPTYDKIALDEESEALIKIQKGDLYCLLPGYRILPAEIENELIFAEKISYYNEFFLFEKDGLSNLYVIRNDESGTIHFEQQFTDGFEGMYDWPIAKKNGKFGLMRLSLEESIPDDKKFYNHKFDSLYFISEGRLLVGVKDGGYYYFNSAIKDTDGTYYSPYLIVGGMQPPQEYLKEKYESIMPNLDLFHGFWQVNEQAYDNIYEKNNDIFVQRDGLYGRVSLDNFNPPSKQLNESMCKSKSDDPDFFKYDLSELINDQLVSYDLLVNEPSGKQIYLFEYTGNFRYMGIDLTENSPIILSSATTVQQMPNNNYILEDDQYLCFFQYNEELKNVLSYESVAERLGNSHWHERPVPPNSYFEGYELLDLNFLGKKKIQTMMDSRGVEYVVTKEFLKKYPKKEDRMEFLSTQQRLSEYRLK
ncbi:MAG: hypothetical protein AB8B56_03540 [Crocinitomicaceae bacterium]